MSKVEVSTEIARMPGDTAIPRRNGELVFDAPWEGRAFGMVVALHRRGVYDWSDFRSQLISESQCDAEDESGIRGDALYYRRWLAAFELTLVAAGVVSKEEIATRHEQLLSGERDEMF